MAWQWSHTSRASALLCLHGTRHTGLPRACPLQIRPSLRQQDTRQLLRPQSAQRTHSRCCRAMSHAPGPRLSKSPDAPLLPGTQVGSHQYVQPLCNFPRAARKCRRVRQGLLLWHGVQEAIWTRKTVRCNDAVQEALLSLEA